MPGERPRACFLKGKRLDIIRVEGGHLISGTVAVSGAKNSALKLMAATLLAPGATTLENVPNISDVHNLKQQDEAREALIKAWNMAKPDGFLEPFIEYHGLMLGQIEACIKPAEPESYRQLSQAVIAFSRGWMAIHNPQLQSSVTDKLMPMEYSIAMLASKGWTNQEIAKQLSLSPNTIKHYLSRIFHLLGIEKREELKPFVNK